jgi:mRNA interferase MazF
MPPLPNRGEIWLADLNPTRGHEQAGARPVLIISTDPFNYGPAGLVFVLPLTKTWASARECHADLSAVAV